MENFVKIKSALISVYNKENIKDIALKLLENEVVIYATGGTYDVLKDLGINPLNIETLTSYPSLLGGRVKTIHPAVFGGILARRDVPGDIEQLDKYEIPQIDLVIVDLYPFKETLEAGATEPEIIEKIDIGGISLIRAAAKNYKDVMVVSSAKQYKEFLDILVNNKGYTSLSARRLFACKAFDISSYYDMCIFNYLNSGEIKAFKQSVSEHEKLRYGENPHQKAVFYGNFRDLFTQLNGKEISYNNLLDIDAGVNLISEIKETAVAIIKHGNACGAACRPVLLEAWKCALAGDPVSAFGGVIVTNSEIDENTACEINKMFFEVLIATSFSNSALQILKSKKNRIILQLKQDKLPLKEFRTVLNGVLEQDKDTCIISADDFNIVTGKKPGAEEVADLLFADLLVKHTKSNAITLVKNKQLIGSGTGQPSRVDALKQAIAKASLYGFNLDGAAMASDAFFPFSDCVEIAHNAGIKAVIQPGGSVNDQASIDYCEKNGIVMVLTGVRHFRH